jgi:peptide/nickel transport system substrate-binding protein
MTFSPESSPSLIDRFLHKIESVASSDKLLLRIGFFALIITGIWVIFSLNVEHSEETPTYGGTITEGILGTPRYVNPALAITRADQDMIALVYSGLMKISPNGDLVNDIAESITISEDGMTYNIIVRNDVKFHDETPLTARDIVYTIQLLQDPDLKSPLRGNWTDVVIEEIGEYELNIVLEEVYAPFIENLTVGIMPAHAWSGLTNEKIPFSQLNTEPIGSGPFSITKTSRDTSGLVGEYTLSAFNEYTTNPKISEIDIAFFENEEMLIGALAEGEIDATAYIPQSLVSETVTDDFKLIEEPLPRTFGIFFNQNRSTAMRDASARKALTTVLNRDALVEKAFFGHGVPITEPIGFIEPELESEEGTNNAVATSGMELAIKILEDGDWEKNDIGIWEKKIDKELITLGVTLRTSNASLFESMSALIAKQWEELGVQVTTEQFEQSGLVNSVIRPRDFQALLFGHDMSRSYDLYPVWHSSQQSDPGLNIAQYANLSVDALLEKAHSEHSETLRIETLREASKVIAEEGPAVFLAQPTLTYIISKDIVTAEMNNLGRPADRFSNIADWHTESESLWPIFRSDIQ